jgi:hypothetical protein
MERPVEREVKAYSTLFGPIYGGEIVYHEVNGYSAKFGQLGRTRTKLTLRERQQKTIKEEANREDE